MAPARYPISLAATLLLAISASQFTAAAAAAEPPFPPFVVSIAVAPDADDPQKPAQTATFIDEQLAEAERLFGKAGVHFHKGPVRALPARFSRLETRKDRDALRAETKPSVINVFLVTSLRDVDDSKLLRMGVHWQPDAKPRKHYIIIAASARPSTLAHELGHFFGNPHSPVMNNLMSYDRDGGEVFLDASQHRKIQAFAKIYLGSKELLPAP